MDAFRAKRLTIREDYLSAPMIALSFLDGRSVAVMDTAPRGGTTEEETEASATTPIIDERIQFGALGAREAPEGEVEFGFWLPGTTNEFSVGFGFGGGRGLEARSAHHRRQRNCRECARRSGSVPGFGQRRRTPNCTSTRMTRTIWTWRASSTTRKQMLALPGRTYDLLGPGWQQEHWRMGTGARGIGAHRTWLPWISVNHIHTIAGLEDFDEAPVSTTCQRPR